MSGVPSAPPDAGRGTLGMLGVLAVLVAALPGEGGASPGWLLVWHVTLGAVLLAVLVTGTERDRGLPAAPLAAFGAFVGVAVVGAWRAPYGYAAFLQLLELGAFGAVVWLAARCGARLIAWLGPTLLAAAAIETGIAAWQRWGLGDPRPAGTFLNANHLAAWLVAAVLVGAGPLWLAGGRGRLRALLALPAGLGLLWTGSRGGLLGLAVGGAYLAWRGWGGLPRVWKRVLPALALVAVGAFGWRQWQRLHETDPYRYHRVRIWRASLQAVVDAPWTGTGPGQFGAAAANLNFDDGTPPLRYERSFSTPHSDLLRAPCELGWPGALTLLLAVGLAGRALARRRRESGGSAAHDAALAALLALGAQALVETLSVRPAVYLLAAALSGAVLSQGLAPAAGRRRSSRALRGAGALVLLALLAIGDVGPFLAWRAADALPPRGRLAPAELERLEVALRRNPLQPEYRLRRAWHLAGDGSTWSVADYAAAREDAEHAVRLQPASQSFLAGLAYVEALAARTLFRDTGSRRRAAAAYERAEALARTNPLLPMERAKLLLDTGEPAGARRAAERALAIEPAAVPARLLLADALLGVGGIAAVPRARALLVEAGEIAERWTHLRDEGPYPAALLALDQVAAERIRRKIAALTTPASPEGP